MGYPGTAAAQRAEGGSGQGEEGEDALLSEGPRKVPLRVASDEAA
jgi:hypothetical protein